MTVFGEWGLLFLLFSSLNTVSALSVRTKSERSPGAAAIARLVLVGELGVSRPWLWSVASPIYYIAEIKAGAIENLCLFVDPLPYLLEASSLSSRSTLETERPHRLGSPVHNQRQKV